MNYEEAVCSFINLVCSHESQLDTSVLYLTDWYLWKTTDVSRTKAALGRKHSISRERSRQVVEYFSDNSAKYSLSTEFIELQGICKRINDAFHQDKWQSLDEFKRILLRNGLLSDSINIDAIIEMMHVIQCPVNFQIFDYTSIPIVIEKDLSELDLRTLFMESRRLISHFGGIMLLSDLRDLLNDTLETTSISFQVLTHCLLNSKFSHHLNLSSDYVGLNHDWNPSKLCTQLCEIFSVFDRVSMHVLNRVLFRIYQKVFRSKSEQDTIDVLSHSSEAYTEYCLCEGLLEKSDVGYVRAGRELLPQISEYEESDRGKKLHNLSCSIVDFLKENSGSRQADDLIEFMRRNDMNKGTINHLLYASPLFYRRGPRRNSFYCTLDYYPSISYVAHDINPPQTRRIEIVENRIIRDTALSREVKLLHSFKCQICGYALQLSADEYYAEAHHIIPLGNPHNGPDCKDNIICVCPNHHALLDYGAIPLDLASLLTCDGHEISAESIVYHNQKIFSDETEDEFNLEN